MNGGKGRARVLRSVHAWQGEGVWTKKREKVHIFRHRWMVRCFQSGFFCPAGGVKEGGRKGRIVADE